MKLTFRKMCAKPQREAKTQRATADESSQREGRRGGGLGVQGLEGEVSGTRSRRRGLGSDV